MRSLAFLVLVGTTTLACSEPTTALEQRPAPRARRLLAMVKTSESMQLTDPPGSDGTTARSRGLAAAVDALTDEPGAEAGILAFGSAAEDLLGGFRSLDNDRAAILAALPTIGTRRGGFSNYQAALEQARDLIAADLDATSAAERGNVTYTVVFIADALPGPVVDGINESETILSLVSELAAGAPPADLAFHTFYLTAFTRPEHQYAARDFLQAMAERGGGRLTTVGQGEAIDLTSVIAE